MSKTTFSVVVADGRGGSKKETRKSAHAYVACVVLTYGAAYVAWCAARRASFEAELVAVRALFAARTAALGGMTPEVAQATYRAANQAFRATFHALPEEKKAEVLAAAGGDLNAAEGLSEDGPFGLCQAAGRVRFLEKLVAEPLPVVGEQVAVSWHSTRALASKARDEKSAHQAACTADDTYAVRTDIAAA